MRRLAPLLAVLLICTHAAAQSYPSKPIKLVVGYPPGGSGDFLTRVMADELARELGVAVIVDNRPGAGGSIVGLTLIVLSIAKTWWDSRVSFVSGVAYLLALNVVYLMLKKRHRARTIAP